MKREKRTLFIDAPNGNELERKLNESLKGLPNADVQVIGKYEACIIYDEFIFETEEKTIADLFEEAGCGAKCSECPHFIKPTDGRRKWTVCGNRRVSEDSRACDSYYLERRKNVSETGRTDEVKRMGHRTPRRLHKVNMVEGIPQEKRGHRVLTA